MGQQATAPMGICVCSSPACNEAAEHIPSHHFSLFQDCGKLVAVGLLAMDGLAAHEHAPGFNGTLTDGIVIAGQGGPRGGMKYLDEMDNQAESSGIPEWERDLGAAARRSAVRTIDVQDLFEDSRRAPVSRLAPGYSVYRRPRMAEEGVPANAELV